MKKNIKWIFILLCCTISIYLPAQQVAPGIQWQSTIGGNKGDEANFAEQTTDGGYILGGFSASNISGDKTENFIGSGGYNDYWIVKIDSSGNVQWENTIGGNCIDQLECIKQTSDGGYIMGGLSCSDISGDKTENCKGDYDYWIVKTDASGNVQWDKTIGGSGSEWLSSLQQTTDGGYIIGGHSNSHISGDKTENCIGGISDYDYWILKTDSQGNIQWQNTIGGSYNEQLNSIKQTYDGGFILAGYSSSNISGDKTENCKGNLDYWIVKTDNLGNVQWDKTIGGNSTDWLNSIQQTIDSGYIAGGYSYSPISGDKTQNSKGGADYWIVKTDASGSIQWDKTIGGGNDDNLSSIQQTTNGGYILGGYSWSGISGDKTENNRDTNLLTSDYWIVKTDASGNLQWDKTIGGNINDNLNFVQQTIDEGYILSGNSLSNISGDKTENNIGGNTSFSDYWIVKLYPDTITLIQEMQNSALEIYLVPNPASSYLTINQAQKNRLNKVTVKSLLGKNIYEGIFANRSKLNIDVSKLLNGVYFVTVENSVGTTTKKFIKQ